MPFSARSDLSVQARGTTSTLFPDQMLVGLSTQAPNITINPDAADAAGPWTVSFTDPTLVLSNATAMSLIGGTVDAVSSTATDILLEPHQRQTV